MNDKLAKVIIACRRMSVRFMVTDRHPEGFFHGPASGGCHPTRGIYLLGWQTDDDDAWAHTLHELAHVVWWHPQFHDEVCEKRLLAWEYAVCRSLGINGYFKTQYTMGTKIHTADGWWTVGDTKHPQRSAWFAWSRAECVRLGALTPEFAPTWTRPNQKLWSETEAL